MDAVSDADDPAPVDPARVDPAPVDPVRAQRARIVAATGVAMRIGYALFALFLVLTVVGLATGLPDPIATGMLVTLIGGTVILAPAILLAYMAKAAERDDRERGL